MELTRKKFVALGSAIFYAFSVPTLVGTWLVVHSQPFTNLFIVLGLLGYVRYVKYHQPGWLIALWLSAIIAPFFRELTVILPVTVLALMLLEKRWDKPLLISMPLLLGHAWFPSFLPNLLHGTIVIQSQFRGGFVLQAPSLDSGVGIIRNLINSYANIAYSMPFQLELFIPPVVTGLAVAGIALFVYSHRKRLADVRLAVALSFAIGLISGILLVLTTITISNMLIVRGYDVSVSELSRKYIFYGVLPLILFLFVPLISLKFGKFFPVWLFVAGVPFLVLYINQDTHIWPASIPWIVMILLWVDYLIAAVRGWISSVPNRRILVRSVYFAVISILAIGFADQSLNIASVRTVWRDIGDKTMQMGERLRKAPKGSMVVSNLYQAVDIEYFAHGNTQHYLSEYWQDYPLPGRVLSERLDFEKAVSEHFPQKDVYLLAEPANPRPSLRYVDDPPGELKLEEQFTVNSRYYFLDPLHNLVPQALWKNTAPRDLLNSFIRSGGPFYREYHQTYRLYKLTSFSPKAAVGK